MADDSRNFHIGQRVSFKDTNQLCTIHYIGSVEGTKGDWLGVEWDDPSRGKHDGTHGGKRYFQCKSNLPTAASFVRPSRPTNPPLTFLEALHKKYASGAQGAASSERFPEKQRVTEAPIKWGGKVVEEVGFEKIRQQLAILNELRIVILDGMFIAYASREKQGKDVAEEIRETCPKIIELDVGRNLFEQWMEVVRICEGLKGLRSLRANGNRFSSIALKVVEDGQGMSAALANVRDLGLDDNFISWKEITTLTAPFTSLTSLSASENCIAHLSPDLPPQSLSILALERNNFTSLSALAPLTALQNLQRLSLKSNKISVVSGAHLPGKESETAPRFSKSLSYVDLSYNAISDWTFIDSLHDVFPALAGLRVSHNPLYEDAAVGSDGKTDPVAMGVEEGYMLTLARLKGLKSLNFSNITPQERTNAEMYYLSRIGRALAAVLEADEPRVLLQHRRYSELCELYGPPVVTRVSASTINPNSLEARLINVTFRLEPSGLMKHQPIPKGVDVYRLKGIVGRIFGVKPLGTRLVWESDEWDPVGGDDGAYDDDDEDDTVTEGGKEGEEKAKGKWMRREVELEDGTREVGFWIEGREATVRVELRQ
ncbi:hypothetical protein FGG08_002886 [Glutinoglossum americanum]|uniref:CAP-Gly domain-containing protein n=1 Tax=Glutinoglossum americanum TaxID=1670608 RepID=A0A9P8I3X6_9PEZI|nr:hypothetical protein FGG08_002886 [Glutinoglossum americanum]